MERKEQSPRSDFKDGRSKWSQQREVQASVGHQTVEGGAR